MFQVPGSKVQVRILKTGNSVADTTRYVLHPQHFFNDFHSAYYSFSLTLTYNILILMTYKFPLGNLYVGTGIAIYRLIWKTL